MRRKAFLPLFFFVALIGIVFAAHLTLEECISLAKENNLELQQTKLNIDNVRCAVTEARSSYYPSLGFSSGYRISGDFSDELSENYSNGISAQYMLYKGGSIRAGSKIANLRVQIAMENYRQKENEVILEVKQAFYKILQIQDQLTLIKNVLQRRKENLMLIKLKYNVGQENAADVALASANLSQSEYDYEKAEHSLFLAKQQLRQLLNLSEPDITITFEEKNIKFPSLDSLIKIATRERPEIISGKINREILSAQITQAKSNYLPSISVSSSGGLSGEKFLEQQSNWNAGINLSLPLFNGFSRQAKVKQANIAVKENDLRIINLINNVETEVLESYADWQLAEKNLEVNRKTLQATREAYQLTKLQYEQGRTSYFFLQQKEGELTQAENSYISSLTNLRNSVAKLENVIGRSN